MSPEVILCRGHSTKADIYSLGATLIHMQTGTPPWVKRYPRSAYPSAGALSKFLIIFGHVTLLFMFYQTS